jgi:hypothetical protein
MSAPRNERGGKPACVMMRLRTSVVHSSERIQAHDLVLLTPAENSWKIRILQEFQD